MLGSRILKLPHGQVCDTLVENGLAMFLARKNHTQKQVLFVLVGRLEHVDDGQHKLLRQTGLVRLHRIKRNLEPRHGARLDLVSVDLRLEQRTRA